MTIKKTGQRPLIRVWGQLVGLFGALFLLLGCTPRVEIAPPEKPININLNVKIDHEVRVKVDRELEGVISEDSELF